MVVVAPEPSQKPAGSIGAEKETLGEAQAVRFSSAVQEISPPVQPESSISPVHVEREESSPFTEVAADQLKALTKSLQGRPLQERRMNTYQFEAFSLPPSRVRYPVPLLHGCF